jgi:hypothetical protein
MKIAMWPQRVHIWYTVNGIWYTDNKYIYIAHHISNSVCEPRIVDMETIGNIEIKYSKKLSP